MIPTPKPRTSKHAAKKPWSGRAEASTVMLAWIASTVFVTVLPGTVVGAEGPAVRVGAAQRPLGEPYELPGKRLVFVNWFYVRPGGFAWLDSQGRSVAVVGNEGPWGAHFRRSDSPYGIRLVAQPAQRMGAILKSERPW